MQATFRATPRILSPRTNRTANDASFVEFLNEFPTCARTRGSCDFKCDLIISFKRIEHWLLETRNRFFYPLSTVFEHHERHRHPLRVRQRQVRALRTELREKVTDAVFTFVAIYDSGRPRPVPALPDLARRILSGCFRRPMLLFPATFR